MFSSFPHLPPELPAHPYPCVLRYSQPLCCVPWPHSPILVLPVVPPCSSSSSLPVSCQLCPLPLSPAGHRGHLLLSPGPSMTKLTTLPCSGLWRQFPCPSPVMLPALSQARRGFGREAKWVVALSYPIEPVGAVATQRGPPLLHCGLCVAGLI